MRIFMPIAVSATLALFAGDLEKARDAQDRLTLAQSYVAEISIEQHDKKAAQASAEKGIAAGEKAVQLKPDSSEYHRLLGTLCGQAIAGGNLLTGMKYGKCALDEVNKAIQLDP